MSKTLIITEKKSVADDFARVLGSGRTGTKAPAEGARVFKPKDLSYESDDLIIAWASGHLLELEAPGAYNKDWKFWRLDKLPIVPEEFRHAPREDDRSGGKLLKNLVELIGRDDVREIVNGCDAGREGELIFNLILEYALQNAKTAKKKEKPEKSEKAEKSAKKHAPAVGIDTAAIREAGKDVKRVWLQSMTAESIRQAFQQRDSASAPKFVHLREAAYMRDQADWLVGMNGTRAFTKRFLGGASKNSMAVGRVKTPTLAFLVDREREIDSFIPVPYFEIGAAFQAGDGKYEGRWTGKDKEGRQTERIGERKTAEEIIAKVKGKAGQATDQVRRTTEKPPRLFDLTSLQRRASSLFGFTLKRTLAIVQTLYEAKKAVTYPRTASSYLPNDYKSEVGGIMEKLARGGFDLAVSKVPNRAHPLPEAPGTVFDDAKVTDHFAIIPTGEVPASLRDDERKIYELIVRRFLAAFCASAERDSFTRLTVVEGETFKTTSRKLVVPGWRAVEPTPEDDTAFPLLPKDGRAQCIDVELYEKETQPPSRFTDGSLVGEMETCGKHVEDEEQAEALKEIGIGTPATRAAIVEDLIYKFLARRDGRTLIPTALGTTLVRLVRNLKLESLAKPDLTGKWERRLRLITEGKDTAADFQSEIVKMVEEMVGIVKSTDDVASVFAADHPAGGVKCPKCGKKMIEKAYSYFCTDDTACGHKIEKNVGGKHLFPEILRRVLEAKGETVGPFTGFERPKAPCKLKLSPDGQIVQEIAGQVAPEDADSLTPVEEQVADGVVMGKCPKCGGEVKSEGAGYKCNAEGCGFRLSKKLLFRELPPAEVKKMLSGTGVESALIEKFISRKGRPFAAHLFFDEKGTLKWKFPERPKKDPAAKPAGKKRAPKKKTTEPVGDESA
jgi:DNA topoisomerase III